VSVQTPPRRLRQRLVEVQGQEEQARRRSAYAAAKAERDRLAEELARVYPGLAKQLADLAKRIKANDDMIQWINRKLPRGTDRLEGAEFIARYVPCRNWQSVPKILDQMTLPAFETDQMKRYLWPTSG
jgi:hypothetical protein